MKVSVVLPTYNRAHIVGQAMKSVLGQTFRDFELIVVDDGSTDVTQDVVAGFKDPRVRYVAHDSNRGLSAGRNTGARAARGRYIANQDSDDLWMPEKLAREIVALETAPSSVGVAYSRLEKTFPDGRKVFLPADGCSPTSGDLHRKLLEGNFITMQVSLIKKECFEAVAGFDESIPALQDWDFWLRVSKQYEFVYVPEIGVRAATSPDSITKNKKKRLEAREMIFQKHYNEFKKYPNIFAHHAFSIGNAYALRGDMKKARRYLMDARASDPKSKYIAASILASLGSTRLYNLVARRS